MATDIKQYRFTIFDMTVEDIKPNRDNNLSDELLGLVDQYINLEGNRVDLVRQIVEKCKQDNVEPQEIRKIIEIKLKSRGLSDRTIYRALPDEFKDKTKQYASSMRKTIGNKQEEQITTDDSDMTLEQLRERNRQKILGDNVDRPVYREPDLVAPTGSTNKIEPKPDPYEQYKTNDYHTMNVPDKSQIPSSSEWLVHNQPQDYTVTTQLQINNGTGNNIGQFITDITIHCSPKDKTVTVDPIDKSSIKKVS